MINVTMRNGELEDLRTTLEEQHALKHDVVVPAENIYSRNGLLTVKGDAQITLDGVNPHSVYRPNGVMLEGISAKLNVPLRYLTRLHTEAVDVFDANVNGLLHGKRRNRNGEVEVLREADARNFLLRIYRDPDAGVGTGRALLSDRYKVQDNLDAIMATLTGIQESGQEVQVVQADVTDRRMYVRFAAPGLTAMAPNLLSGYRSPFTEEGDERGELRRWREIAHREGMGYDDGEPVIFAGFDVRNSETGNGSFDILPVITVRVCKNGLTIPAARFKRIHLGAQMQEGAIDWAADTQRAAAELVQKQARDAVSAFCSPEFLQQQVNVIEAQAGKVIRNPEKRVTEICSALKFTEDEQAKVWEHFIRGGQGTAGGLANAITSASQLLPDADRAYELDDSALKALALV